MMQGFITITTLMAVLALAYFVCSKRFKLPILMESGMALLALGFFSAVDALNTPISADRTAAYMRWLMISCGVLLIVLSVAGRLLVSNTPKRRTSDWVPLDQKENSQ